MNSINIVSYFSFFLMILVFFFLAQQFDIGECFWEDSDVDGLRTNSKNQTFSLRGAPYDQNPSLTSTNNIDIDDDSYPKKYNAKVIIPKDKNIKPAVNLQNDETDDELSSHDDKGLEDRHPEDPKLNPISSTSTTIPSFPTYGQIKATKICVTLTPEYVSTRNGPLVSYECIAKICTGISPDQADKVKGEYQFRRPLFDWNTGYSHLFVNNGTCDQDGLICRNKVDINVDSFLDTMEQSGLEQMEIRCVVADYIQSYDGFNYVTGEAMGVLKQFKGNRPHEPCNTTSDCGDNLICVRSTIREPFLSDSEDNNSQDKESYAGYCECSTDDGSEIVVHSHPKQSYILMEDDQYQEQVCVPIRSLNQSCQYDQQCKQSDPNTYCRPLYTEDGIATTNLICDCMVGYYVATTTTTTQSTTIGTAVQNRCISGDSREDDSQDFDYDVSDGEEAKSDSSNKHEMVYIWWIFPPNSQQSHEILNKDLHGLPYYARRYLTIRNLSYILLVLTIVIPSVIIMISLAIYYYRKRSDSRQFQPRRTSFEDDSLGGVYFPGKPVSDICDEKPISFFEQIPSVQLNLCNLKQSQPQIFNDEDQRENISHDDQTEKVNNLNKKNEDKLNLVLNDQLDIEFGTQNINHNDEEEEEDQDERKFP